MQSALRGHDLEQPDEEAAPDALDHILAVDEHAVAEGMMLHVHPPFAGGANALLLSRSGSVMGQALLEREHRRCFSAMSRHIKSARSAVQLGPQV